MKKLLLCLLFLLIPAVSEAAESLPPTLKPEAQHRDHAYTWETRHEAVKERHRNIKPEYVFIGDSITDNYRKDNLPCQDFLPIWKKYYAPYNAFNAGFNGNTTDDVLARIGGNGILDHVSPKVVQIMIGTNDTGRGNTEEETFNGICRVVNKVHSKLPHASILLVGILPSDIYNWHVAAAAYPDKKFKRDMAVNDRLARLYAKNPFVTFLDIRDVFLDGNGKVREELFCDPSVVVINGKKAGPLHPNTEGQRLMAEAIQPTLARLMKKHSKQESRGIFPFSLPE